MAGLSIARGADSRHDESQHGAAQVLPGTTPNRGSRKFKSSAEIHIRCRSGPTVQDSSPKTKPARVVVGIPTLGRGAILAPVVRHLATQNRLPDLVVVCGTEPSDFGDLDQKDVPFELCFLTSPRGCCHQRNRVLELLDPGDVLLFLDDDFLLAPDHLARFEALYTDNSEVVMSTGEVLADGIIGPGFSFDAGLAALEAGLKAPPRNGIRDTRNAYGCNMGIRMRVVAENQLRFDEALPAYAWFEDVDFSVRAGRHGRIVHSDALRGVHLGTKTHRTAGKKLGYSQVANLAYLMRKGTLTAKDGLAQILRNLAANCARSISPVPYADHRGRLRGNLIAFADLVRGRADPGRIDRL